jgi:hypothetical protein
VTAFTYEHPSRCNACQSTRRTAYEARTEEACQTTLGNGLPVTHVVRARCRCLNCGGIRIDTIYHYNPDGGPVDREAEEAPRIAANLEFEAKLNKLRELADSQPEVFAKQPAITKGKRGIGSKT